MFKSEIAVHHHGLAIFLCKDERVEASSLNTMQALGLISLLIAIGIGVMFMTSDTKINNDGDTVGSTHESAIDAAKEAVGAIEVSTGGGGRSISIYDGVSVPSGSTKVDLSGRGLSGSLKAEIRHVSGLQELDLSNNNFTGLPAEVGQLSQLRILNLSNNPFTGLPHELGNLKNLQTLDLRGTSASQFDVDMIKSNLPSSVEVLGP